MFWDTPLVDVKLVSFWLHLSKFNFNFYFLFRKLIKFGIIYVAYIWFLLSVLWILFFLLKFDLTIWILAFVLYFWKMFLHVDRSSSMPGPNVGSLLTGMRHCLCQSKGPGCPSRCYYHQSDSLNPITPYHAPQPSPSQEHVSSFVKLCLLVLALLPSLSY